MKRKPETNAQSFARGMLAGIDLCLGIAHKRGNVLRKMVKAGDRAALQYQKNIGHDTNRKPR